MSMSFKLHCYKPCTASNLCQLRGCLNLSTKVSILDFNGQWYPLAGLVHRCANIIALLELPKVADGQTCAGPTSCAFMYIETTYKMVVWNAP